MLAIGSKRDSNGCLKQVEIVGLGFNKIGRIGHIGHIIGEEAQRGGMGAGEQAVKIGLTGSGDWGYRMDRWAG
jgi:hypothetical protein